MSRTIEAAIRRNQWTKARVLIRRELKRLPDSHWLLTRLGLTYYEEYRYESALKFSKRALSLAPDCPLVLWDYAGSLEMMGYRHKAVAVFQRLIRRGVRRIAYEECGEGLVWARSLVAGCHYRLGCCLVKMKEPSGARVAFNKHLRLRKRGYKSIYSVREVRRELKNISTRPSP